MPTRHDRLIQGHSAPACSLWLSVVSWESTNSHNWTTLQSGPSAAGAAASADHQHRPVRQVDALVGRAAEHGAGEIAPAPGPHDDDVGIVLLGVREDLTRRVPERGRPYLALGVNA